MTPKNYTFRHQLLKLTRRYFESQNFIEVEVPLLNSTLPLEQNIYSFNTIWSQKQTKYYLPTSPELALKTALSTGLGDCFAIGKCFRNLENTSKYHTPEFTMLEWYQLGTDYHQTADKVAEYINYIYAGFNKIEINRVDYLLKDLFTKFAHLDLDRFLTSPDFSESDFNSIFLNDIEPHIPTDKLVFIFNYPSLLSPLALPLTNTPYAARFECYLDGIEIANGCTENLDPTLVRQSFETESANRQKNHLPTHSWNQSTIDSLTKIPPCSGVGLGLDRVLRIIQK